MPTYADRRARAAALMRERGIEALLLTPSSDLAYACGYRLATSERLTCLVLDARGAASLVVPVLEAPRARAAAADVPLVTWDETDDPIARVRELAREAKRLAVADQMWAAFVLRLEHAFPGAELVSASDVLAPLRMRKEDGEVAMLRAAGAAADRAFERLVKDVRFRGRREREVAKDLAAILLEEGHDEAKFTIVASGPNGASPHHETGFRAIQDGDVVVCDFGGPVNGYGSDITRTVFVGKGAIPDEVRRVHDTVLRAQEAGYRAARAGVPAQDVDRASRRVIADAGYGAAFLHRTGHGIGLDGHEQPYLVEGNTQPLEPSMTFSIEPGIYLEGKFGVRIEDIAALTRDSAEPLNRVERGLARVR